MTSGLIRSYEGSCERETTIEINIVRHMLRTTGTGTRLYGEK